MADQIPPAEPPDEDPIIRIEQHLVGALLQNAKKALAALPESFSTTHYKDELCRDIHDVVASLGAGVIQLIALRLPGADARYLSSLMTSCPTWTAAPEYASAVSDAHHRRGLVAIAEDVLAAARSASRELPAEAIAQRALAALDAQVSRTERHRQGSSLNHAMDAAVDAAQRAARGEQMTGRSTGMTTVDEALGGLDEGTFNVLGARPGAGKTALGCQWAIAIGKTCKVQRAGGVLVISLEMQAKALGRRVLAEAARISVTDLKRGRIDGRVDRLERARFELADLPIQIEDAGGQNIAAIRQKTRAAARRFGTLALIMVDHIQIVTPDEADRRNGGTQAVGRVSNALRDMSKEFNCPVLCLSQLNRGLLERDDKRPNMGDLRQAGDIEQDADVVMFLHREEMYLPKSPPTQGVSDTASRHASKVDRWREAQVNAAGKVELIFAKVRDGAPCTVPLRWHGETTSFSEEQKPSESSSLSNLAAWDDRYFEGGPPGGY